MGRKMKTVNLKLNYDELVLLGGGLGHYYNYLEQMQKREKTIKRKRELEIVKDDINKLTDTINEARFVLGSWGK